MNTYKRLLAYSLIMGITLIIMIPACQKFTRPELVIIPDPLPPTYNALKSYWQFENNNTDEGESKLTATASALTYTAGISGQAVKIGPGGYLLLKAVGDSVKFPNGFIGLPADTLRNLGSFTLSFWMNGTGPVVDGAQGIFAISSKTEFWGNLEIFLENYSSTTDANAAWIKIHMLNAGLASGNGEEWTSDDNTKLGNVLNRWTHVALTYDAATSKLNLYKDGAVTPVNNKTLGSGNYGKIKFDNFNGMVLGNFAFQTTPTLSNHGPETWAKSFNGALDQFRLYNRALSATEITELYTTKK